ASASSRNLCDGQVAGAAAEDGRGLCDHAAIGHMRPQHRVYASARAIVKPNSRSVRHRATAFAQGISRGRHLLAWTSRDITLLDILRLHTRQSMDFLRFFRRKNPYEEFDELLGPYRARRPRPFWRLRSYVGYHAKEFL